MMRRCMMIAAAALAASAAPLAAQTTAAAATAQSAPVDPARLALGQRIAAAVMPDGIYARMMRPLMDQLGGQVMNQAMAMPMRDLAAMAGPEAAKALQGPGTMRQVMAVLDPAFERRQQATMRAMVDGMIPIMTAMEPELRAAVARLYARRFSESELREIAGFYATPTGAKAAQEMIAMAGDPEFMQASMGMMPRLMQAMPDIMRRVQADTADLPKPRTFEQLTPAEREQLARLIGVDPAALNKRRGGS